MTHSVFSNDLSAKQKFWTTWNGTESFQIESLYTPSTQEELIALVQKAKEFGKKIKVLGSGHSLNAISLPEHNEWVVSLENYAKILNIDPLQQTITVQAGATLKQVNEALDKEGLSLENLGSISDQTVGGVFQTGTHGTGKAYGPLHTQILSLSFINGKGELKTVSPSESPELFRACQCGLGTMGIINTVTFRAVPAKLLHEKTFAAPWPEVLDHLEDLIQKNDYFRFYLFPYIHRAGVWTANGTSKNNLPQFIKDPSSLQSIEDLLEKGPTDPTILSAFNRAFFEVDYGSPFERIDRSDHILNVDCGAHSHCVAVEACFLARHTKSFLLELEKLVEMNHFPAHGGIEIRFVKSDAAYLSPTYSDSDELFCFVNIVSIRPNSKPVPYQDYFRAFQNLVEKYEGRLHWGKGGEFNPAYLQQSYPHWDTFLKLQKQEDPAEMFLNQFTRKILK